MAIIRRIQRAQGVPSFSDDSLLSSAPDFARYTWIYGYNGCGKTTLSRGLNAIGCGEVPNGWSADWEFEIESSAGARARSGELSADFNGRLLVFNEDFVSRSISWSSAKANPVLYIGTAQIELSEQLDSIKDRIEPIAPRLRASEERLNRSNRALKQFRTDLARELESSLALGRGYNASALEKDFQVIQESSTCLEDEERRRLEDLVRQGVPSEPIDPIPDKPLELRPFVERVLEFLQRTVGQSAVTLLRGRETLAPWLSEGVQFHQDANLSECSFCGGLLSGERLAELAAAVNAGVSEFLSEVESLAASKEELIGALQLVRSSFPRLTDMATARRKVLQGEIDAFEALARDATELLDECHVLLEQKSESLSAPLDSTGRVSLDRCAEMEGRLGTCLAGVNAVVQSHNDERLRFRERKADAKCQLKEGRLREQLRSHEALVVRVRRLSAVVDKRRASLEGLEVEQRALKASMRDHAIAAESINDRIRAYLGHGDLTIEAVEEGYEIKRRGLRASAPPSEGERTAIALSYFLVWIQADGRSLNECIVVLDDPISSLDSHALNYACSLIQTLESAAQLIVLTHNFNVLNELRKWKRPKRSKGSEDSECALLMIEARGSEGRSSALKQLPKYLREYDSEYHYLFSMVLSFHGEGGGSEEAFFAMPNVLRKVLETFLAFKRPGSNGLQSKIDAIRKIAPDLSLDPSRLASLNRLVQVESHGDSLDDLNSFSPMTLEEAHKAAGVLIDLMRALDPDHLKAMSKLCRVR